MATRTCKYYAKTQESMGKVGCVHEFEATTKESDSETNPETLGKPTARFFEILGNLVTGLESYCLRTVLIHRDSMFI